jgi:hypothetical protein
VTKRVRGAFVLRHCPEKWALAFLLPADLVPICRHAYRNGVNAPHCVQPRPVPPCLAAYQQLYQPPEAC